MFCAFCLLSAEVGGVVTHEDLRVPGMVSRVVTFTLACIYFSKKVFFFFTKK